MRSTDRETQEQDRQIKHVRKSLAGCGNSGSLPPVIKTQASRGGGRGCGGVGRSLAVLQARVRKVVQLLCQVELPSRGVQLKQFEQCLARLS